ncbi:hypothetical protein ACPEEZ_00170 [Frigoribacterium sp. 2-23]|uniref:hypothetical protein n=1 Tax=Frigoribacterium sp. 2-23 TaxID=3415006 RepID=UPI003C6FADCC
MTTLASGLAATTRFAAADLLLVDIATGRYLPGDSIEPETAAREHDCTPLEMHAALADLRRAGLVTQAMFAPGMVVVWHHRYNETLMRRLGRLLALAVAKQPDLETVAEPVRRATAAEAHGLQLPDDAARFFDIARALVSVLPAAVAGHAVTDLITPLETMYSTTSMTVHGITPALSEAVRHTIVDLLEHAAHYGEWTDVCGFVADYGVAIGADAPAAA